MIEAQAVTVRSGARALLQSVNLCCAGGTLTALVGPNGAGKSTLLSVIAGDRVPDEGKILLCGKPVSGYSVRALAQIRSVFPQGSVIRFGYSVAEVVAMGRAFRELPPTDDDAAIRDAMLAAEIEDMARRNAQTLSGGEQARTTFARVEVQDTPVILLDEPTAALDLRHQERVLQRARQRADAGACVVAVLHDLNLAGAHADKIVLLSEGRVAATGTPREVFRRDRLEAVYRQSVHILDHPTRDCPVVVTT